MAVTRADGVHFDAKPAGADLREKLMFLVKVDTDGRLVLAGNTELVYGVITETGNTDEPVTVQTGGLAKVVAGAEITAGQRVMSDGSGKAVPVAGASAFSFGIARNGAGADGVVVEVEIDRTRGA